MTDKPNVYISGPMTGIADYNYPAFRDAEKRLLAAGFAVHNPAWIGAHDEWDAWDYRTAGLRAMETMQETHGASKCAVALLPGWRPSFGCLLEVALASRLGWFVGEIEGVLKSLGDVRRFCPFAAPADLIANVEERLEQSEHERHSYLCGRALDECRQALDALTGKGANK